MDVTSSTEQNCSWESLSVSRTQRRSDVVRTVTVDDRRVRILPKYRRRGQRSYCNAVNWTSSQLSSSVHRQTGDDLTALNGSIVTQGTTTESKAASERQTTETRSSSKACQSVMPDGNTYDAVTALELSDEEDHDADERLNASAPSRTSASKLTAALPGSRANRELPRMDNQDHQHIEQDFQHTVPDHHRIVYHRLVSWCRNFISFLASTLGLTCLLVVYTLLGGVLFVCPSCYQKHFSRCPQLTCRMIVM